MEALAALSVACNVIQIVQTGQEAASVCRQIYKDGKDVQTSILLETTQSLESAILESQNLPGLMRMKGLAATSQACVKTAGELKKELDSITLSGKRGSLRVLGKTLKSMVKAGNIQKLKGQLNAYESTMNTQILVQLSKMITELGDTQKKALQDLPTKLQSLAEDLKAGNKTLGDLLTTQHQNVMSSLKSEHEATQKHITKALDSAASAQAQILRRQQLLDALYFPEIAQRQEEVKSAHKKTFEWIFDEEKSETCPWSNFTQWLASGQTPYWINGKPGSGKSTLMNFIVHDERSRTLKFLNAWSGGRCCILSAFFWSTGSQLQKNAIGLLRTLLWQLLQQDLELDSTVWTRIETLLSCGTTNPTWTEKRLIATLDAALKSASFHVCLFLDGLDEFEDEDVVLSLLDRFDGLSNVKMCVSSRPEMAFTTAFRDNPQLRLQDLTNADIEMFVNERLSIQLSGNHGKIASLTQNILRNASGVFLWVDLVVKDLIRGLRNGDSIAQLEQRLELMPGGIYALYAHMLQQSNSDIAVYRSDAAKYFRLVMIHGDMQLLYFALAIDEASLDTFLTSDGEWNYDIVCKVDYGRVARCIQSRCAGLLELDDQLPPATETLTCFPPDASAELRLEEYLGSPAIELCVRFIHRTAHDFLQDPINGRTVLGDDQSATINTLRCIRKAELVTTILLCVLDHDVRGARIWVSDVIMEDKDYGLMAMAIPALRRMFATHLIDVQPPDTWLGDFFHDPVPGSEEKGINFLFWLHQFGAVNCVLDFLQTLRTSSMTLDQSTLSQLGFATIATGNAIRPPTKAIPWLVEAGLDLNTSVYRDFSPKRTRSLLEACYFSNFMDPEDRRPVERAFEERLPQRWILIEPTLRGLRPIRPTNDSEVRTLYFRSEIDPAGPWYHDGGYSDSIFLAQNFRLLLFYDSLDHTWHHVCEKDSELYVTNRIYKAKRHGLDLGRGILPHLVDPEDDLGGHNAYFDSLGSNGRKLNTVEEIGEILEWPVLLLDEIQGLQRMLFWTEADAGPDDGGLREEDEEQLMERMALRLQGLRRWDMDGMSELNERFVDWFTGKYGPKKD